MENAANYMTPSVWFTLVLQDKRVYINHHTQTERETQKLAAALRRTQTRTSCGEQCQGDVGRTGFLLLLHYSLWNVVFISWFPTVPHHPHHHPRWLFSVAQCTRSHTHATVFIVVPLPLSRKQCVTDALKQNQNSEAKKRKKKKKEYLTKKGHLFS